MATRKKTAERNGGTKKKKLWAKKGLSMRTADAVQKMLAVLIPNLEREAAQRKRGRQKASRATSHD
jgi:hypothetical protein